MFSSDLTVSRAPAGTFEIVIKNRCFAIYVQHKSYTLLTLAVSQSVILCGTLLLHCKKGYGFPAPPPPSQDVTNQTPHGDGKNDNLFHSVVAGFFPTWFFFDINSMQINSI